MNLKLDLSMVNTILMVIVLILVIVACVRRYREKFTSNYFIQPLCDDPKFKDTLNCVRGSQGAGEGSEFDFKELSEITSGDELMNWAKSDDSILDKYTVVPKGEIGVSNINDQIKMNRNILIGILDRILQSFNVQQEPDKLQSLVIVEENASTYLSKDDKWSPVNEENFNSYIKTNGGFDITNAAKIKMLTVANLPQGLLIMPEVDENGNPDNNLRNLKDKKYRQLLKGGDNTESDENYVIKDSPNGNAINFNTLLDNILDEKKLKENWVRTITANITNEAHLKLAYASIMSNTEIAQKFP
jgi:hypothetical protein